MRGLTLLAFFKSDDTSIGSSQCVIGKWDHAIPRRSYRIYLDLNGRVVGAISVDGTIITTVFTPVGVDTNWHFVAFRWKPSTELRLQLDEDEYTNLAAIPATVYTSAITSISIYSDWSGMDSAEDLYFSWGAVYMNYLPDDCIKAIRALSYPAWLS